MINDHSYFESEEKLSKLHSEFENYHKLIIKEKQSEGQ
jgi:hypothetical protein